MQTKTKTFFHDEPEETAFTDDLPPEVAVAIYDCARGSYQADLLIGHENWSGSSIASSNQWPARYAESRANLLARIRAALPDGYDARDLLVLLGTPRRWARELVIDTPAGPHLFGAYHA